MSVELQWFSPNLKSLDRKLHFGNYTIRLLMMESSQLGWTLQYNFVVLLCTIYLGTIPMQLLSQTANSYIYPGIAADKPPPTHKPLSPSPQL